MSERNRLKRPSDYPLFSFRLQGEEEKRLIDNEIKKALERLNRGRKSGEHKMIGKGALIKHALIAGLSKIKVEDLE